MEVIIERIKELEIEINFMKETFDSLESFEKRSFASKINNLQRTLDINKELLNLIQNKGVKNGK